MNQTTPCNQYKITLALNGVNEIIDKNIVQDLSEEIKARSYIIVPQITHDASLHQVIIEFILEDLDQERAVKSTVEEFYEIGHAILKHIEGVYIKIISIELVNNSL